MAQRIYIADYGVGNIRSLVNAFEHAGASVRLASNPDELGHADKIVLPGVGAFAQAIARLQASHFVEALDVMRQKGTPVLGVCLGMQLMCRSSDEGGETPGLGWIDADVMHLKKIATTDSAVKLKFPHMGWNELSLKRSHRVVEGVSNHADVYFVHSHAVHCDVASDVLATTHYGEEFCSAFQRENLIGMQFHPEKSHRVGLKIVSNFLAL